MPASFDQYSDGYEDFLRDPVRDRFAPSGHIYFHHRKVGQLCQFLSAQQLGSSRLSLLDVGCGTGEFLSLCAPQFGHVEGCDISESMLRLPRSKGLTVRLQEFPRRIPYGNSEFDVVTANCVFHHVPDEDRITLLSEIHRVLKPSGVLCAVEHNPFNPVTRAIVKRTPVDTDAKLLTAGLFRRLARTAGFEIRTTRFYLYLPEKLYTRLSWFEDLLAWVPLGGQYALFCRKW